jgi:hypothetical protein
VTVTRTLIVGGAAVGALAVGWFFLSHLAMGTSTGDAVNEAFGVAFGILILFSVVGAVRARRGNHP